MTTTTMRHYVYFASICWRYSRSQGRADYLHMHSLCHYGVLLQWCERFNVMGPLIVAVNYKCFAVYIRPLRSAFLQTLCCVLWLEDVAVVGGPATKL